MTIEQKRFHPCLPIYGHNFRGKMNRKCRVTNCWSEAASQFAAYCSAHKAANRRHGAPRQKGITKTALKPYLRRVAKRITTNATSKAWSILNQRWEALAAASRASVEAWFSGRPGSRIERTAAYEITKLSDDDKGREVIITTAAMVLMREEEPSRFVSDDAFWVQLSRRVRSLTYMNVGESYDHTTNRMKRHYRDIPPKAALVLGRTLATTLGAAGLHIARLEKAATEQRNAECAALHGALNDLV